MATSVTTEKLPATSARGVSLQRRVQRALLRAALAWYGRRGRSLNHQIQAFTARSLLLLPRRIREAIRAEQAENRALGDLETALRVGDAAPAFVLADHRGVRIGLTDLAADGCAVIAFLRGGWCPACNLELRALAKRQAELRALGAQVAVVSPERPGGDSSFENVSPVDLPILVDEGNRVARSYGVARTFGESLRSILGHIGTDLREHNGDDSFVLPIPAIYVIDRTFRIRIAYVFGSYIDRMEPDDLVAAIRALRV
jgi:peroxiredoxin